MISYGHGQQVITHRDVGASFGPLGDKGCDIVIAPQDRHVTLMTGG